ncbi:MAG: hypothetical protein K2W95_05090 [Candidatus Obscuribacterales bacterium]|nr:hypothetical protein [Candidatus Obscuribacterales bacterium]
MMLLVRQSRLLILLAWAVLCSGWFCGTLPVGASDAQLHAGGNRVLVAQSNSGGTSTKQGSSDAQGAAPSAVPAGVGLDDAETDEILRAKQPSEDNTLFYAFLDDSPRDAGGPLYDLLKDKVFFKDYLMPHDRVDRKFRPMAQLRFWWDQPQKFLPAVAFCTFIAWVFWFLIPQKLTMAQDAIRGGFWKCFGSGFFCVGIWLLFNRAVFLTHVGWPLGIVSAACFQAGLLIGFSVIVSMIGHAFAVLARVKHWPLVSQNAQAVRVIELLIGSICCAGIIMVPSPAALPHASMRLLFLFAVLGLGAVCRVYRQAPGSAAQS